MNYKLFLLIVVIFIAIASRVSAQVLPDLIVDTIDVSNTDPRSGDMVSINIGIRNIGTNTSPYFPYDLYSTDQKFGERRVSTNWYYNKLEVGKTMKTTLQATIFGPTTIKFIIDPENTVPELDDLNNEKIIKIGFEEAITSQVLPEPIVDSTSQQEEEKRGFSWPKFSFIQTTFSGRDPVAITGLSLAAFIVISIIIYGVMRIFNRKENSEEKESEK